MICAVDRMQSLSRKDGFIRRYGVKLDNSNKFKWLAGGIGYFHKNELNFIKGVK